MPTWYGEILDKAKMQLKSRGPEARREIVILGMMLDNLLKGGGGE